MNVPTRKADDARPGFIAHEGKVLVAEDDAAMRELLAETLRADGRMVVRVTSGRELLQMATEAPSQRPEDAFDVIVADHRMPDGDGLDMIEELRRAGCFIPALLVTAFADDDLRTRADGLDTMVMSKPFRLRTFRTAVGVLFSLSARRR
jgi:two-component system OmpR family response regulator